MWTRCLTYSESTYFAVCHGLMLFNGSATELNFGRRASWFSQVTRNLVTVLYDQMSLRFIFRETGYLRDMQI